MRDYDKAGAAELAAEYRRQERYKEACEIQQATEEEHAEYFEAYREKPPRIIWEELRRLLGTGRMVSRESERADVRLAKSIRDIENFTGSQIVSLEQLCDERDKLEDTLAKWVALESCVVDRYSRLYAIYRVRCQTLRIPPHDAQYKGVRMTYAEWQEQSEIRLREELDRKGL